MMAQRLYEAGYITYMRTDSTNLSKEAVEAVREYIGEQYGAAYLPSDPNLYGAKANAQEAHEAIRPSSVLVTAEMLEGMEPDAMRLYDLIWRQFVACQMTPAQYDSSTLTVKAGEFELKARGRTLRFAGWTKALPPMGRKGEDSQLPAVTVGEILKLVKLDPRQHFTSRPPASPKRRWYASWRSAASTVRLPTLPSSPPSSTVVMCGSRAAVSSPRRWVRSSPTGWWKTSSS